MNHSTMNDLKSLFTGATLNFTNSTMTIFINGQAAEKEERDESFNHEQFEEFIHWSHFKFHQFNDGHLKEERGKVHNFLCK